MIGAAGHLGRLGSAKRGGSPGSSAVALSAVASPATRTFTGGDGDWHAGTFTCTPSGGTAPYSYVWSVQSTTGNQEGISPEGALGAVLTEIFDFLSETAPTVVIRCTVTDALGAVAVSNTVSGVP